MRSTLNNAAKQEQRGIAPGIRRHIPGTESTRPESLRLNVLRTGRFSAGVPLLFSVFCFLFSACSQAQYATKVWVYDSTNANPSFLNPLNALGPPSTVSTPTVPDNSGVVSVGPGGYIILGFDKPIRHNANHPGGLDFIVFGSAFYVGGNIHIRYQKPALIEVGVDVNGNGCDVSDPFYRLQGSPNPMSGYPYRGIDDRTFTTWGYANVTPTDGTGNPGLPDDPFAPGLTTGSAGGDAFSLLWAVDANGLPVLLDHIDFVRISPAGNWPCAIDAVGAVTVLLPHHALLQPSPARILLRH